MPDFNDAVEEEDDLLDQPYKTQWTHEALTIASVDDDSLKDDELVITMYMCICVKFHYTIINSAVLFKRSYIRKTVKTHEV